MVGLVVIATFILLALFAPLLAPIFFGAFIVAGFAPWNLILFTPLDVIFAVWTLVALRGSMTT